MTLLNPSSNGLRLLFVLLTSTALATACASSGGSRYQRLSFSPGDPVVEHVNRSVTNSAAWFSPIVKRADLVMDRYDGANRRSIGPYLEADIYLYDDEELNQYLQSIVNNLATALDFQLPKTEIVVETNPRFSAYIDELLQIHLSTGLLRSLSNEDQVAGVIAHELGHLVLRHNLEKKTTSNISNAIEFASSLSSQLGRNRSARRSLDIDSNDTRSAVDSLDTVALLWTDLLEPSWSRKNEQEADFFAMDLMKAAGYNHEQLIVAIGKIHDAAAVRNYRLDRLSSITGDLIEQRKNSSIKKDDKQYVKDIGDKSAELVSALTDRGVSFLAEKGASHDGKEDRIRALKSYINTTYSQYDLPPDTKDGEFTRIVNGGSNQEQLKKDLAAVETMIAISKRNMTAARERLSVLNENESGAPQLATAMAQNAVSVANRKYDAALDQLTELSNNPNAPAEVFIKLAKLQASKRQYEEAEKTLLKGSERIGRRYRFLPTFIKLYRQQRRTERAEQATLDCAEYDDDKVLQFVSLVSEIRLDSVGSYYRHCADILGYDVREKRNAKRREQMEGIKEQASQALEKWID